MNEGSPKEEILCGAYLRSVRREKGVSLEKVSEKTKILSSLLKSLEEDDYSQLPPSAFLHGMIKKYAQFLELDPDKIIQLYQKSNGRHLSSGQYDLLPHNRFQVKQFNIFLFLKKPLFFVLRISLFILIIAYFVYEIFLFLLPPNIVFSSPSVDFSTTQSQFVLEGKVVRGKSLFWGDKEIPLDKRGNFQKEIVLVPGLNEIELRAVNNLGKSTFVTRNIIYTRP